MVKCVKKNQAFLRSVAKASRFRRKNLIKKATEDQLKALHQITNNVAQEIVPLKHCVIKKLIKGKYKPYIREAASKKAGAKRRKKIFVQHGGFLQYVIPAALLYLKDLL